MVIEDVAVDLCTFEIERASICLGPRTLLYGLGTYAT